MLALRLRHFSTSPSHFPAFFPTKPFFLYATLVTHHSQEEASSTPRNPVLYKYLVETVNLSDSKALKISDSFSSKTLTKPQQVVAFFRSLGFTETQIQTSISVIPQILFSDVETTLKPKLNFFRELGLSGPLLGKLVAKNPSVLTRSLDKKIKPCIQIIKEFLDRDFNNHDLLKTINRCSWILYVNEPSVLLSNIEYFQSCGIVGSQLAMLLKRQPRLFTLRRPEVEKLLAKALEMGFEINSRMLVHGVNTLVCISKETYQRKLDLFMEFGFSEAEFSGMIRRAPGLLRASEVKLRFGIKFFLETAKVDKKALMKKPTSLMYNMDDRVVARHKVLKFLKEKGLLTKRKQLSFLNILCLSDADFIAKYISRFEDLVEELLMVYKGNLLDTSEE